MSHKPTLDTDAAAVGDSTQRAPAASNAGEIEVIEVKALAKDVIICVHDPARAALTRRSIDAVWSRLRPSDSLTVVLDNPNLDAVQYTPSARTPGAGQNPSATHNPSAARTRDARQQSPSPTFRLLRTSPTRSQGLSAARNLGMAAGTNPIICFFDDDAIPNPSWNHALDRAFSRTEVTAVGGTVRPWFIASLRPTAAGWQRLPRPAVLPPEHDWVFGCDYVGLPAHEQPIRNPIGAAMAVRRRAAEATGNFDTAFGRTGGKRNAAGAEETEFFLRLSHKLPGALIVRDTEFCVDHAVPPERTTPQYFLRRAYGEGRSKALLSALPHADLGNESHHAWSVMPRAVVSHVEAAVRHRQGAGWGRAALSVAVLLAAAAGFGREKLSLVANSKQRRIARQSGAESSGINPELPLAPAAPQTDIAHPGAIAAVDPQVSVILCSTAAHPQLRRSIRAILRAMDHAATAASLNSELLLIANNVPATKHTRENLAWLQELASHEPRLRIIHSPHKGLARARNLGTSLAAASIVAFTDDDTFVSPDWITELHAGFDAPEVWCVTGRTTSSAGSSATSARTTSSASSTNSANNASAQRTHTTTNGTTSAQHWFEKHVSFDKGPTSTRWSLHHPHPPFLYPYPAGNFGSGNNMAFRTTALHTLGGFTPALGAGRATRGGEDLDIFRRTILSGGTIHYRPTATATHQHRTTYPALRQQMFGYGAGMAASLAHCALHSPRAAIHILAHTPQGLVRLLRGRSGGVGKEKETQPTPHPTRATTAARHAQLVGAEMAGYMLGGWLYLATLGTDTLRAHLRTHLRRNPVQPKPQPQPESQPQPQAQAKTQAAAAAKPGSPAPTNGETRGTKH